MQGQSVSVRGGGWCPPPFPPFFHTLSPLHLNCISGPPNQAVGGGGELHKKIIPWTVETSSQRAKETRKAAIRVCPREAADPGWGQSPAGLREHHENVRS